jgi:hypothetical protein
LDCLGAHGGNVIGLADPEVLRIAGISGRILLSHDRSTMPGHFWRLVKDVGSPGPIIVPQDLDIGLGN